MSQEPENEILKLRLKGCRLRLRRRPSAAGGEGADVGPEVIGRVPVDRGLYGWIIAALNGIGASEGKLRRRERLGGMFNYYYRDAA